MTKRTNLSPPQQCWEDKECVDLHLIPCFDNDYRNTTCQHAAREGRVERSTEVRQAGEHRFTRTNKQRHGTNKAKRHCLRHSKNWKDNYVLLPVFQLSDQKCVHKKHSILQPLPSKTLILLPKSDYDAINNSIFV